VSLDNSSATLVNNQISYGRAGGLLLRGSSTPTIKQNKIMFNEGVNLAVLDEASPIVEDNFLTASPARGETCSRPSVRERFWKSHDCLTHTFEQFVGLVIISKSCGIYSRNIICNSGLANVYVGGQVRTPSHSTLSPNPPFAL